MGNKRKIPWFWRWRYSCPDCGMNFGEDPYFSNSVNCMTMDELGREVSFTCPRCGVHYSREEFIELNHDKYSKKADLSEEECFI